jgi:hypothetical protein
MPLGTAKVNHISYSKSFRNKQNNFIFKEGKVVGKVPLQSLEPRKPRKLLSKLQRHALILLKSLSPKHYKVMSERSSNPFVKAELKAVHPIIEKLDSIEHTIYLHLVRGTSSRKIYRALQIKLSKFDHAKDIYDLLVRRYIIYTFSKISSQKKYFASLQQSCDNPFQDQS